MGDLSREDRLAVTGMFGDDLLSVFDMLAVIRPDWHGTAACRPNRRDPDHPGYMVARTNEFFHNESGHLDVEAARAVCATCPHTGLYGRCLDAAMRDETNIPKQTKWRTGVRAGFTPRERVELVLRDPYYAAMAAEPFLEEPDGTTTPQGDRADAAAG